MRTHLASSKLLLAVGIVASVLWVAPRVASAVATVAVINGDGAGEGFNDPTPAAPVGGNPGTTIGQQRLIAFQFAADIWGATLDSNVPIVVLATFDPLSCNATSATLGSAGATFIFANFAAAPPFPGPEFPNTWYSSALADKRAGVEINPGQADIRARFNSNLGNAGCLTGVFWYYGLDGNHGSNIDLVTVLLHEMGHGLGFQQFASLTSGAQPGGLTDVYARYLLDTTTGKSWDQMTNAERVASAINSRKVVWTGAQVTANVPNVLAPGTPLLRVNSPGGIAGTYAVGTASFGPALGSPGVTGDLVLVNDGVAPVTDGCSALTAGSLAGKIALIDRGTCTFAVKAKIAQNAGAIAVVIADNVAGAPPAGLGGTDPTITIPSVRITLADGNLLKANLGSGVNVTLGVDLLVRAGADAIGRAIMNAPNPVQVGSSISHWDPIAFPNQLMEPAINDDLTHAVAPPLDLTLPLFRDVGWFPDANLNGVSDDQECILTCGPDIVVDNDPGKCGAVVHYPAPATFGNCGAVTCTPPSGSLFPVGETTVACTGNFGASCSFKVTVNDAESPIIANVSASPASLWPPNHTMKGVTIGYDATDNCPGTTCVLSVASNEPVDGTGDGDTAPDWEIVDAHHVQLRAERAGTGTGRIYTITITCTDAANHTVNQTVAVVVPHDQRGATNRNVMASGGKVGGDLPRTLSFGLVGVNPAVGAAGFRFGLPARSQVELSIYDVAGRRVERLVTDYLEPGYHATAWDPSGSNRGAGVYFARLTVNGRTFTQRFVLIR